MTVRVYRAQWVLPISSPPIVDGAVAVDGSQITWVGAAADAPDGPVIDLRASVLMPGLVNVHSHLELTAMRGYLEDLAFRPWIVKLTKSREQVMTVERRRAAARVGIAEGLLAGITSYGDVSDSGESLVAMREMGVRGTMYREVFGPHPAQAEEAVAGLAAEVERWQEEATDRVRVGVSPHAPYTVSDALFRATAELARARALPLTVHIAEGEAEEDLVVRGTGPFAEAWRARGIAVAPRASSPVSLLHETGVLETRALLVHVVRASAADIELVRRAGVAVALCPASNAKLGHGIAPMIELLNAGIPAGLGSDSVASSNRLDLLDEARLAVLQQRARCGCPDAPTSREMLRVATLGGAQALGIDERVGTLDVGKAADLVAFPIDPLRDGPVFRPEDALVYGAAGRRARLVSVDGVDLVRDGRLLRDLRTDLCAMEELARAVAGVSG